MTNYQQAQYESLARRLGEKVAEWRQPCPAQPYAMPEGVVCWPNCKDCGSTGWVPGVAEPGGEFRRIHMEDVLAYCWLSETPYDVLLTISSVILDAQDDGSDVRTAAFLLDRVMTVLAEALEAA